VLPWLRVERTVAYPRRTNAAAQLTIVAVASMVGTYPIEPGSTIKDIASPFGALTCVNSLGRRPHAAAPLIRARSLLITLPAHAIPLAPDGTRVETSSSAIYVLKCVKPSERSTMTTFDKREDGFEKKFAHDEELKFKAAARRNKLLGQWAAEKLGLTGAEVDAYAKEVIAADFEEAGDEDVFRKLRKDFDAKGVKESDHQIRRTMQELMEKAVAQIKAGP
jgi:hypothetical protein